jgi:hypothetical protein
MLVRHRIGREQLVIEPVAVPDLLRHDLASRSCVAGEDVGEGEYDRALDDRAVGGERRHAGDGACEAEREGRATEDALDVRHIAGVHVGDRHRERRVDLGDAGDGVTPDLGRGRPRRDRDRVVDQRGRAHAGVVFARLEERTVVHQVDHAVRTGGRREHDQRDEPETNT